jgi:hypothetical protein
MRGTRALGAGLFGLGYLISSGAPNAAAEPPPVVVLQGRITDETGRAAGGRNVDVMLMEHRTPAEVEAGADQAAVVVRGSATDRAGRYTIELSADDIPDGYVGPDGRVQARLLSPEATSAVFQVADFDLDGTTDDEAVTATPRFGPPVVTVDATAVATPGRDPSIAGANGYDYCNFTFESYAWEDTGLGMRPFASVGPVYTGPSISMEIGVFNGSQHRHDSFVSVGGSYLQGGLTESLDTSVDWSILFGPNTNIDLRAEMQFRHHQLACYNLNTGAKRYANVGEYYPWRPTAGTMAVPRTGVPFECANTSPHVGPQNIAVSRGRTRTTSGSFGIGGVPGRVSLGISTSNVVTSTTINRVTIQGVLGQSHTFTLCGSDANVPPIDATWVREK